MSWDDEHDVDLSLDFAQQELPNHKQTENIVEDFSRFRDHPYEFMKTLLRHAKGSSWRAYEDYVGQRLYEPGLTEFLKEETMRNEQLQSKIDELVKIQIEREINGFKNDNVRVKREAELQSWLKTRAEEIVEEMSCSFDHKSILQFMYYVVAQIFARTYHQGVHVNSLEIDSLRTKGKELQEKKQSMIFLPCHKSHIDYMSIQFICFRVGISLPTVVAGDNLNFAVIGPMLRQVGAMYIRRSFNNDKLYINVMQAFIETLLSNGYNFECFIEGTRSRTGKLLPPKFGILKFILDALLSGRVQDSWVVPVSTQYDKVAEAETYAIELLGKEKKKENFMDFINARKIMSLQMGRVDVRFHRGWSLREFVESQINKELTRSNMLMERKVTAEMKTRILRSLGYRVLADINKISVVMPTALIGTMLLTLRGRGIGKVELIRRVEWFVNQIQKRGGRVGDFNHPTIEHLVEDGISVLGPELVGTVRETLLEPTYYSNDAFKLSYYRNQVIHLFVSEAMVCASIYFKHQEQLTGEPQISYSELLERVQFLSRLFSSEFVYGPDGIQTNLAQTLNELVADEVLTVTMDATTGEKMISIAQAEIEKGKEIFEFYCFLVWPFLDGFWLVLVALMSITASENPNTEQEKIWVSEKVFLSQSQVLGKTLYHQGILVYYEAVNKEMLKNGLNHWYNEGVVIRRPEDGFMSLGKGWCGDEGRRICELSEKIGLYRRLIRVRRDVPLINPRVVKMIREDMKVRDVVKL